MKVLAVLAAGAIGAFGGCLGPSAAPVPVVSTGTSMEMVGDWNDLKPAAMVAVSQSEMAIIRWHETMPGRLQQVELLTVGDEPASLRFTTTGDRDPRPIQARCRVGTFGDAARERQLLERVNRRLEQLKGKDWAPIQR